MAVDPRLISSSLIMEISKPDSRKRGGSESCDPIGPEYSLGGFY